MSRSGPSRFTRAACATSALLVALPVSGHVVAGHDVQQSTVIVRDLSLVSQSFNVEATGALTGVVQLPASIQLAAVPTATLVVTAYGRVLSRFEVAQALDGELPRSLDSVDLVAVDLPVPAPGQLQFTVPIETGNRTPVALQLSRAGVYPVVIELRDDGEVLADLITFVQRLPDADEDPLAELPIAVAMATTAPVALDDDTDVVIDEEIVAELNRLADLLESSPVPVAVSVPPALLAALAEGDDELTALSTRLTDALAEHDLLSAPSLPLDPSAAAAAGEHALYTQWLRDGEDVLAVAVTKPSVRTIAFVDEPLSQAGGALLRDLGARLLVLTPELYDELPDTLGPGYTDPTLLVQLEVRPDVTLDATIVDRGVSATLARPTNTPTLTAIYTVADLLGARQQIDDAGGDPRRHGLTLATPDLSLPPVATFEAIMALIAATPGLRSTTLDDLGVRTDQQQVDDEDVIVGLPETVGSDISGRSSLADALALEAAGTASMLPTTDPRPAEWARVIALLPTSALSDPQVAAIADDLHGQNSAIRGSVEVPTGFPFTLTGRRTTVPITLHNTSTIPITVRVRMTSSKLIFPDGDQTVTLPPGAFTNVPIRIEARSNGRFPVTLEVFTPFGDGALAPPVPLTASVNALSGLGNLVTGALLLVVLTWWVRHVRQNRRKNAASSAASRHPVADGQADTPDEGALSPDAESSSAGSAPSAQSRPTTTLPGVSTNRVRIVTDSACDLPQAVADELGIEIVPLTIRIDGHEYVDRADLTPAEFWAKCAASPDLPETAAPAPGQFEATYRRLAADGATSVVAINLSAALSATMQSAELAARSVTDDIQVTVVDSQQATLGLGAIVIDCARLAAGGASHQAIVDRANDLATRTKVWGALDTLENLKKGGRIGGAKAMLASALAIKPIIEVRDGKVEQGGKQRTRSKALAFLVETLTEAGPVENLMVMHADCSDVDAFVDMLRPHYAGEIVIGDIGPVVGTHTGRGTIGIAYCTKR